MCLAVIAVEMHPDWPLIIVANRDEYHARPTDFARAWATQPSILAGRDLRAGGTWLGVSVSGKIGLLTNYREPTAQRPDAPSRGTLVENYLLGAHTAENYALSLQSDLAIFNGFNLLLADEHGVLYVSNRGCTQQTAVERGVVGLSNATLGTAWPKVLRTQNAVGLHLASTDIPDPEIFFEIFRDDTPALSKDLPSTGLPIARELKLSSPFILDPLYGTRCSTLVMKNRSGHIRFEERSFDPTGQTSHRCAWLIDTQHQSVSALK